MSDIHEVERLLEEGKRQYSMEPQAAVATLKSAYELGLVQAHPRFSSGEIEYFYALACKACGNDREAMNRMMDAMRKSKGEKVGDSEAFKIIMEANVRGTGGESYAYQASLQLIEPETISRWHSVTEPESQENVDLDCATTSPGKAKNPRSGDILETAQRDPEVPETPKLGQDVIASMTPADKERGEQKGLEFHRHRFNLSLLVEAALVGVAVGAAAGYFELNFAMVVGLLLLTTAWVLGTIFWCAYDIDRLKPVLWKRIMWGLGLLATGAVAGYIYIWIRRGGSAKHPVTHRTSRMADVLLVVPIAIWMGLGTSYLVGSQTATIARDGGSVILLKASAPSGSQDVDTAQRILEKRAESIARGSTVEALPMRQFRVQLPGIENPESAARVLQMTGMVELALVREGGGEEIRSLHDSDSALTKKERETLLGPTWLELSKHVRSVETRVSISPTFSDDPRFLDLIVELDQIGSTRLGDITESNIKKQLAIVIDDVVVGAPTIQSRVSDAVVISGMNKDEAVALAVALEGGALPFDLNIVSQEYVAPKAR